MNDELLSNFKGVMALRWCFVLTKILEKVEEIHKIEQNRLKMMEMKNLENHLWAPGKVLSLLLLIDCLQLLVIKWLQENCFQTSPALDSSIRLKQKRVQHQRTVLYFISPNRLISSGLRFTLPCFDTYVFEAKTRKHKEQLCLCSWCTGWSWSGAAAESNNRQQPGQQQESWMRRRYQRQGSRRGARALTGCRVRPCDFRKFTESSAGCGGPRSYAAVTWHMGGMIDEISERECHYSPER